MASKEIQELKSLLDSSEIIEPGSPHYASESITWAEQKNLKPKVIIRPKDVESLSKAVAYLNKSSLQFGVRSQGYGSASAQDVLISMTAFNHFEWDKKTETVLLGAGQSWGDYYEKMEMAAPDYQVVSIRTPAIGVGGSILCGGYSWMSREFGCTSDPKNLLDAQVVKLDGSIVWASTEPDLMFALRGAGGGFGFVTTYKLQAYKYPQDIFCGPIMIPKSSISEVAKGIEFATGRESDVKMSLFLYVLPKELLGFEGPDEDVMVVHAYDACGEKHGRSEAGFKWALDIPGAKDFTGVMNLRGVALLQAKLGANVGKAAFHGTPVALNQQITANMVHKTIDWYDKVIALGPSFRRYSMVLIELSCIRDPVGCKPSDLPWPRPSNVSHYLTMGYGYKEEEAKKEGTEAMDMLLKGPAEILGEEYDIITTVPNYIEEFHDVPGMFAENYQRLRDIKRKYDPHNRLVSPIKA